MKIVAALGGNALLRRGEAMTAKAQRYNVRRAAVAIASLIRAGHQMVVTHGNGPQVGLLALQSAGGPPESQFPLDVLGAESEGMIGYLIEQELNNVLPAGTLIATLLTQTLVDPKDPAFRKPDKPIGPVYHEREAHRMIAERGWSLMSEPRGWRRAVASPEPLEILEARVISMLVDQKVIVICAGGGGIPVVERESGEFIGVEAVVDKDRASALLARQLRADMLLLLTDVDGVYTDFGTDTARRLERITPAELRKMHFASGSMGPKVDAAMAFVTMTGRTAGIGRLEDASAIVAGRAGTIIEMAPRPGRS